MELEDEDDFKVLNSTNWIFASGSTEALKIDDNQRRWFEFKYAPKVFTQTEEQKIAFAEFFNNKLIVITEKDENK